MNKMDERKKKLLAYLKKKKADTIFEINNIALTKK
jgi:hypothetical protein